MDMKIFKTEKLKPFVWLGRQQEVDYNGGGKG